DSFAVHVVLRGSAERRNSTDLSILLLYKSVRLVAPSDIGWFASSCNSMTLRRMSRARCHRGSLHRRRWDRGIGPSRARRPPTPATIPRSFGLRRRCHTRPASLPRRDWRNRATLVAERDLRHRRSAILHDRRALTPT